MILLKRICFFGIGWLFMLNSLICQANPIVIQSDIESFDKEESINLLKRVADWQLDNPTVKNVNVWEFGPFYQGLLSLYQITHAEKYLNSVIEAAVEVDWQPVPRPYDANSLAVVQSFLDLYILFKEDSMIEKSVFMMEMPLKRWLEPEVQFAGNKYWYEWWTWCDALYMAPPAYAKLYQITEDEKYLDFLVQRWQITADYLFSEPDSLFFRDDSFFSQRSKNGKKIFWSRGNGWVMAGLVEVLAIIPDHHPQKGQFVNQLRAISSKLTDLQTGDGYWGQSLLDLANYRQKETSGTALIVYALASGINQGYLEPKKYLPAVLSGWTFLLRSVKPEGKLVHVQPVGEAPVHFNSNNSEVFGVGAFLMAGSEIIKLNQMK